MPPQGQMPPQGMGMMPNGGMNGMMPQMGGMGM
jgi:hypothetical protein